MKALYSILLSLPWFWPAYIELLNCAQILTFFNKNEIIWNWYLEITFIHKDVTSLTPKNHFFVYCHIFARSHLRSRLVKTVSKSLGCCELKVVSLSSCKLNDLFSFKDTLCYFLVYRCTRSNCNVTYYGKTYHHFFRRAVWTVVTKTRKQM